MIASHSTIATPAAPTRVAQLVRELFAATPLSTFISALRSR